MRDRLERGGEQRRARVAGEALVGVVGLQQPAVEPVMTMPMPASSNTARNFISLSRSASAAATRSDTSRNATTAPATAPSNSSGDEVHSAGKQVPSRRHITVSSTRTVRPSRNAW